MAVGKTLRFEVFKRDMFRCMYCGRTPPSVELEVDHIHPVSKGGTDGMSNLLTSCFDCNRGKRDNLLNVIPQSMDEQIEKNQERLEQLRALNELALQEYQYYEDCVTNLSYLWMMNLGKDPSRYCLNRECKASAKVFIQKLGLDEILWAMNVAFKKKTNLNDEMGIFNYFCGICWNKIKGANKHGS